MPDQLAWLLKRLPTMLAAMAEPGAVNVPLVGPVRQGGPATKHEKLIFYLQSN